MEEGGGRGGRVNEWEDETLARVALDGNGDGNDADERAMAKEGEKEREREREREWGESARVEGEGSGGWVRRHGRRGGKRAASSKVGKKPRKGLCLVRGPTGGRKLRVFVCPPIRSRDRWSFSYPPIHVPGKRGRLALERRE